MGIGKVSADLEFNSDKSVKKLERDLPKKGKMLGSSFGAGIAAGVAAAGVTAAIGAAVSGFRKLAQFRRESIELAAIQEKAVNELNIALANTGKFSEQASLDLQKFASSLQQTSTFGDEAILSNAALIQSLGNLPTDKLKDATTAAADLSAALGIDLRAAATLVGKAAAGEVGSFSRYGLVIKKAKTTTETFDKALKALQDKFGGAAAGQIKTYAGSTAQLSNAFGDFQESIGALTTKSPAFIAVINTTSDLFAKLATNILKLSEKDPLKGFFQSLVSIARVVNESIIPPFRVFFGFIQTGFNVLKVGFQEIINFFAQALDATLGKLFRGLENFPGKIGEIAKEAGEVIGNIAETTQEVLKEQTATALDDLVSPEDTENFKNNIEQIITSYDEAISKATEFKVETKNAIKETGKQAEQTATTINKALQTAVKGGIVRSFAELGKAFAGAQSGLDNFGNFILSVIGDIAIAIGTAVITAAKTIEALKASIFGPIGTGLAAIALGGALIAIGSILKAKGGSDGGDSTVGGGGGFGEGTIATQSEFIPTADEEREEPGTSVVLNINGSVFDSDETGLRISQILEEQSLNNGVRIVGGIA